MLSLIEFPNGILHFYYNKIPTYLYKRQEGRSVISSIVWMGILKKEKEIFH